MSSRPKLIQMCATLLGRRHLVNAYKIHAEWLIQFVDKRVGGTTSVIMCGQWPLFHRLRGSANPV